MHTSNQILLQILCQVYPSETLCFGNIQIKTAQGQEYPGGKVMSLMLSTIILIGNIAMEAILFLRAKLKDTTT